MDLTVKRGDAITADKWNALVEKTRGVDLSFRPSRARRKIHLAEFVEESSWVRRDGLYRRQARFVDIIKGGKTLRENPSGEFEVTTLYLTGNIRGERFYVVWRGRWEYLYWRGGYPRLETQEGVSIAPVDGSVNEYTISNTGVLSCNGETGYLTMDPAQFYTTSDPDSVGARVITPRLGGYAITGVRVNPDAPSGRLTKPAAVPLICDLCGGAVSDGWIFSDAIVYHKLLSDGRAYIGIDEI